MALFVVISCCGGRARNTDRSTLRRRRRLLSRPWPFGARRNRSERLQGHDNRIRLVILCGAGVGVHAHSNHPPSRTLPAKPAAPVPGISFVRGIVCGSYPSLLTVTAMSAFRLAWTTQGVTQAVGMSSPDISAVAPEGVVEIEMFSVVTRVTDAQPAHSSASAAAKNSLIMELVPHPANNFTQPAAEGKWRYPNRMIVVNEGDGELGPDRPFRQDHPRTLPSLFKLIRGIVRGTDSPCPARAQHMK